MSVTITITDPATTPVEELRAVVTMLSRFLPSEATINIHVGAPDVREAAAQGAREAFEGFIPLQRNEAGNLSMVAPEEKAAVVESASRVWYEDTAPAVDALAAFGVPVPPPLPSSTPIADLLVPTPPAPAGVELDKDGIPWDGRIHASTKTKTVEAVWKKKRGVEQAEVDRVTAELRTTMMAPAASVVEAPPAPPAQVAMAFATGAATPMPPAPPAPPAATGVTFAEFMGHVTGGVTSGRFTREAVAEACAKHGAANLPGLINRPDLIPAVARELGLMA
ncbi:MAG: hypothetical protein B7Z31_00185 [Rhodobacterales bacterium 12-65-15]|nr:MAG: hypothetical protein B7Z31_00185 [Rhodobacterales bacterium 12-65-15]